MTTQRLSHEPARDRSAHDEPDARDGALDDLFDRSPAPSARTSAAAEVGFLTGLTGVVASVFSLLLGLSMVLAAVALVCSVLGLAKASRRGVAGGILASLGLVCAVAVAGLVALRYAGIDTAVGDGVVPTLTDGLRSLNALFPRP